MITQTDFIKRYCDMNKISEDELNQSGYFAVLCDCNKNDCLGWSIINKNNLYLHTELYIASSESKMKISYREVYQREIKDNKKCKICGKKIKKEK